MANQEQQQFKIVDAYITADRLGGYGNKINVNNMIVELVLFENLEKPYVTGNVAILDDAGVFDGISFSGTERISFGISSEKDTDPSSGLKFRTFIMSSIENLIKASDNGNSGL